MGRARGLSLVERVKTSEYSFFNCAEGRFGAAFFMDSGSSCGEIAGHAKV
jgi:hypothetical protein